MIQIRSNRATPYKFITVLTDDLTHDGFISLGNFRAPHAGKFRLPDTAKLGRQHEHYVAIIEFVRGLIEGRYSQAEAELAKHFRLEEYNSQ